MLMFKKKCATIHRPEPTDEPQPRLNFFGSSRPKYPEDGWYVSTVDPNVFILCSINDPVFGLSLNKSDDGFLFFHLFETENERGVDRGSIFDNIFERCPPGFSITIAQPSK